MHSSVEKARRLAFAVSVAATVHCGANNANSTNNTNPNNSNASTSSANASASSGAAAETSSASSSAAPAGAWITREEAERRLRANAMVVEHLRNERATYGDAPDFEVGGTPAQGCTRGAPECQWVFATEMRTSSTHAEPLHFAVDPYTGTVTRCSDDTCRERSER
ncbi:MAG: hypothetical protein JNK05_35605 [Myxococcales bacterium]|nr:hypothetical protein [Myxococcales bacterium]